ncbi:MAG: carbon starvation protein A [Planctomycetaceae bacterium]|jgi:carbon starvation protein|nr:carbon starvation protein A [Planctomycetaceae bacterium]
MNTLAVMFLSFFGFVIAYNTYGKWLARKIFRLNPDARTPSHELQDGIDYVPTRRSVVFGHHFTSIAGTGPIVGPAIAVMWGWLPALLWVVLGSIFIGAVHDFTALVISLRNKGQTLGDIAGEVLTPSARIAFLFLLAFLLAIVIAVFSLVIATIFTMFPRSVIPIWLSLPVAVVIGILIHRLHWKLLVPSLTALIVLYAGTALSSYVFPPVFMPRIEGVSLGTPLLLWTGILLIYCFAASVLPVWLLLQPRDYVNSHQLYAAMFLMLAGLLLAGLTNKADIFQSAPALHIAEAKAAGAPPIFPFLFITVACGAVSGFHALVSSGTSSKQVDKETDALAIGYGGMLLEGALAVLVIISCTAGIGMGVSGTQTEITDIRSQAPDNLFGRDAWESRYNKEYSKFNLGQQVGVFIEGSANFLENVGLHSTFALGIMSVLVAGFAATTLDTATRLMRYVIQELAGVFRAKTMKNKYTATLLAVAIAGALALCPQEPGGEYGKGGMILWPLFAGGNQLVAGMTLVVGVVYLMRRRMPSVFLAVPAAIMFIIPVWGMLLSLFSPGSGFLARGQWHLVIPGLGVIVLGCWLVFAAIMTIRKLLKLKHDSES